MRPTPDPFSSPFFAAHPTRQTIAIRDHRNQPRVYTFPTFFTQTPATMALFTGDEKRARLLVNSQGDHGLHPVRVSRGRCLVAIAAYRYGLISDGMEGYNELAVGFPVSRSKVPLAPALLRRVWSSFGIFVAALPVDSEENCHRGVSIWGLPKTMKHFGYEERGGKRTITVRGSDEALCVRLSYPRGGKRTIISETNQVYSVRDGKLVSARAALDGAAWQFTRVSPLAKQVELEIGRAITPYSDIATLDIDPRPVLLREFDSLSTALYPPG